MFFCFFVDVCVCVVCVAGDRDISMHFLITGVDLAALKILVLGFG